MKNKICATLDENHIYTCSSKIIARSGENEITQLEITLAECLCNSWVYLDFVKADGTKFKTPRLDVVGNVVTYDLPNSLLDISGDLKVQVVLQDESGEVWKSTIKTYRVSNSINATDDIPNKEDFITEAQTLLNEIEEGLTPTIGENENWFIGDKDTGKPSRGPEGKQGPKGEPGSVKFIIANELPTENIDESAIYMIPAGTTSEGNTYAEYIYVNGKWESLGSASVNVDLADYVKNTDYATKDTAGVVKINNNYGVNISPSTQQLQVAAASNSQIDNKASTFNPIVPYRLDYAVKVGMTTNTEEWTEEEKTSARDLINAQEKLTAGTNITIENGVISATGGGSGEESSYELPIASADTLGGIKVGENLNIDENGVLSASAGGGSSIPVLEGAIHPSDLEAGYYILKDGGKVHYGSSSIGVDGDSPLLINKDLDDNDCTFLVFQTSSSGRIILGYERKSGTSYSGSYQNMKFNQLLTKDNTTSFTPSSDYNPSTKLYTDKTHYEKMAGYDATKTQILKNVNGTLTWVTEE